MNCLWNECGGWTSRPVACFNRLAAHVPCAARQPCQRTNCGSGGGNAHSQSANNCCQHPPQNCAVQTNAICNQLITHRSCKTRRKTHNPCGATKEQWYETNRNIIMALGRIMGLHADTVADFLYCLTLQNFSKVLNPRGHYWNNCNVPLSNFDTCDYYVGIFDSAGNVRNPYHPKSLLVLLRIMQSVLKENSRSDNGAHKSLFGSDRWPMPKSFGIKAIRKSKKKSDRAGIGPDSSARQNGIRRRYHLHENYRLGGIRHNCSCTNKIWNCYNKNVESIFGPFAGNNGQIMPSRDPYSASKGTKDNLCRDQNRKSFFGPGGPGWKLAGTPPTGFRSSDRDYLFDLSLLRDIGNKGGMSDRGRRLSELFGDILGRMGVKHKNEKFIDGILKLNLRNAQQNEPIYRKAVIENISEEYNRRASTVVEPPGTRDPHKTHHHHHKKKSAIVKEEEPPPRHHYYYGAQVPILAHQPFNPDDPSTWIRRHPKNLRMDETGHFVPEGTIHRYRRETVQNIFEDVRRRDSVRSVYTVDSDDTVNADALPASITPNQKGSNSKQNK